MTMSKAVYQDCRAFVESLLSHTLEWDKIIPILDNTKKSHTVTVD